MLHSSPTSWIWVNSNHKLEEGISPSEHLTFWKEIPSARVLEAQTHSLQWLYVMTAYRPRDLLFKQGHFWLLRWYSLYFRESFTVVQCLKVYCTAPQNLSRILLFFNTEGFLNLRNCQENPSHTVKQNILGRIAKMYGLVAQNFCFYFSLQSQNLTIYYWTFTWKLSRYTCCHKQYMKAFAKPYVRVVWFGSF